MLCFTSNLNITLSSATSWMPSNLKKQMNSVLWFTSIFQINNTQSQNVESNVELPNHSATNNKTKHLKNWRSISALFYYTLSNYPVFAFKLKFVSWSLWRWLKKIVVWDNVLNYFAWRKKPSLQVYTCSTSTIQATEKYQSTFF